MERTWAVPTWPGEPARANLFGRGSLDHEDLIGSVNLFVADVIGPRGLTAEQLATAASIEGVSLPPELRQQLVGAEREAVETTLEAAAKPSPD